MVVGSGRRRWRALRLPRLRALDHGAHAGMIVLAGMPAALAIFAQPTTVALVRGCCSATTPSCAATWCRSISPQPRRAHQRHHERDRAVCAPPRRCSLTWLLLALPGYRELLLGPLGSARWWCWPSRWRGRRSVRRRARRRTAAAASARAERLRRHRLAPPFQRSRQPVAVTPSSTIRCAASLR